MFWERFNKLCEAQSTKPNPVGAKIGISSGIITKWKSGSIPNGENLIKLSDYFNCSIDYLLGRTDNPEINRAPVFIPEPVNIIKIPFIMSRVSAGKGAYISDEPPEVLEIDAETYPKADMAITIKGDSMQPKYNDGNIILVHKQPCLENGQIGIFRLNNEGYIKEYHVDEDNKITLVSLNPKYPPIPVNENDDFAIEGLVLCSF